MQIHQRIKLVTLVEGDPKAPFLIATTPKCRGGRSSFLWIAPVYPWSLPYSASIHTLYCWVLSKKFQGPFFESLVWHDLGLNSGLPDHWRTLYSLVDWPATPKDTESKFYKKRQVWFGWVGFYGISTIVGYLMLNPLCDCW